MSTWLYLQCLSHDPPLLADGESGQHLYDLPQIRSDVADREALVKAPILEASFDDHFRANTVRFLVQHQKCEIGIIDEYRTQHPLVEPQPD